MHSLPPCIKLYNFAELHFEMVAWLVTVELYLYDYASNKIQLFANTWIVHISSIIKRSDWESMILLQNTAILQHSLQHQYWLQQLQSMTNRLFVWIWLLWGCSSENRRFQNWKKSLAIDLKYYVGIFFLYKFNIFFHCCFDVRLCWDQCSVSSGDNLTTLYWHILTPSITLFLCTCLNEVVTRYMSYDSKIKLWKALKASVIILQ